jgi:hypothetical protein
MFFIFSFFGLFCLSASHPECIPPLGSSRKWDNKFDISGKLEALSKGGSRWTAGKHFEPDPKPGEQTVGTTPIPRAMEPSLLKILCTPPLGSSLAQEALLPTCTVFLSIELRSIPMFMGPRRKIAIKLATRQLGHYVPTSSGHLFRPYGDRLWFQCLSGSHRTLRHPDSGTEN